MQYFFKRLWCVILLLGLLPASVMANTTQRGGIVLSFDDWFVDQWHAFFTELQTTNPEIAPHSTFFVAHWLSDLKGVNQNRLGNESHYAKLKQLEDAGHEIAAHGLNHVGARTAPYNLACDQANAYVGAEVQPALTAMGQGDPGIASDYGFIPRSFSYPYGEHTTFYDNAVKTTTGIRYLRGTFDTDFSKPLKNTDAIYHRVTGASYPYLIGDGIDNAYQNELPEIKEALDRASANDEVITLYAHRILQPGETSNYGIPAAKLKEIILYAHNKGLKFYRFSEAFNEMPEANGACGGGSNGGGGSGNPANLTFLYADNKGNNTFRVGLEWRDLPNDTLHIALASQPTVSLSSASTGGSVSGKMGINIANVIAGAEYVAHAYSGSINVATSAPFVIVAGNPPPPPPVDTLAAPSNLNATLINGNKIQLTWHDNSSDETGFKIERCLGETCSDFTVIKTQGANVVTFTNSSLSTNQVYRYRVRAYKGAVFSEYSSVINVPTLAAPSNLTVTVMAGGQANVVWADANQHVLGFDLERCTGKSCTNFTQVASVAANVLHVTDSGLQAGNSYRYRIRAFNTAGASAYSRVVRVNIR